MTYLIDTDWVADYLLGQQDAVHLLSELGRGRLSISAVTYMEIVEGIMGSRSPRQTDRGFRSFLRHGRVLVVSRGIAGRAAAIRFDLRQRHRPIDHRVLDLIVAATAIEHRLILVTRNTRDYADIPDLQLHQST